MSLISTIIRSDIDILDDRNAAAKAAAEAAARDAISSESQTPAESHNAASISGANTTTPSAPKFQRLVYSSFDRPKTLESIESSSGTMVGLRRKINKHLAARL